MKVWCEIEGTAGYRGDVNVMNVDGDIVDSCCNREVLSDGVGGEGDGVMNEGDKSSTTRGVTRTVLTVSSVDWKGVCWKNFG